MPHCTHGLNSEPFTIPFSLGIHKVHLLPRARPGRVSAKHASAENGGDIAVPARYWKVLLVLPFGEDDLTRINTSTRVIAVDVPNTQSANALEWYDYRTSVDAIEDSTGLDVLNALGTELQGLLEVGVDAGPVN